MRLWDPGVLKDSIIALQGLKPYYQFNDVDIDRYVLNGHGQMGMIAPRDINTQGLTASAQTWVNMRLQFTHGFGVVVLPVNRRTQSSPPELIEGDIPPVGPPQP